MSLAAPAMTADTLPFAQFEGRPIANAPLNGWQAGPYPDHDDTGDPLPATPWQGRLVIDANISETSPVVVGTYITTRHVASLVIDGWSWAEILRAHPELVDDDIRACLAYAIEEDTPDFD
ncbi:MAG: DUF433 domain-containing protein [Isosphaeraceae bacterium]